MDGIASVDLLWFRRLPFNNSMHVDDALVRSSSEVTASSDTGTWMGGDEGLVGKRLALLKDVVRDYREWRRS
jgi:hypothetical protein